MKVEVEAERLFALFWFGGGACTPATPRVDLRLLGLVLAAALLAVLAQVKLHEEHEQRDDVHEVDHGHAEEKRNKPLGHNTYQEQKEGGATHRRGYWHDSGFMRMVMAWMFMVMNCSICSWVRYLPHHGAELNVDRK